MMRVFRDLEIRRLVAALLLAPLLLYAVFSANIMPRFSDEGLGIVICTGDGLGALSPATSDDPDAPPQPAPCDWAMQIHSAALFEPLSAVEPAPVIRAQAVSFAQTLLRSGRLNASSRARAPPVSV
tara:strand:- start:1838 stop:2215 length:378 start_codon:yes stop_codon:yes gene_type:complete